MIKDFPLERYKFYVIENARTVVAVSTFAGKKYRGVAKCAPTDEWDIEYGKRLAAARCGMKIAVKRLHYAQAQAEQSRAWANETLGLYIKDNQYVNDALEVAQKAEKNLIAILNHE